MRALIILLTILLSLYPILELTRLIVIGFSQHPSMRYLFIGELVVMWTMYLVIAPMLWGVLKEVK